MDKLEADGIVTRVHGGAIWNEGTRKEGMHFYRRLSRHLKEKQEIARKASVVLEGKYTIIADSSSTVAEALKLLPESPDVTIVTNSAEVFHEFQQSAFELFLQAESSIKNLYLYKDSLQKAILQSIMYILH